MSTKFTIRHIENFYIRGAELLSYHTSGVKFFAQDFAPCVFNLAHACELYLKFPYNVKTGLPYPRNTHRLKQLTNLLDKQTILLVQERYEEFSPMLTFKDCIRIHSNANATFRYLHEKSKASADPRSLFCLATALQSVAADICRDDESPERQQLLTNSM